MANKLMERVDTIHLDTRQGSDHWGDHKHGEQDHLDGRKSKHPKARRVPPMQLYREGAFDSEEAEKD
ncbi:MAG: hypothetical protein ABID04_03895 [Patescibacteria group bacterium]